MKTIPYLCGMMKEGMSIFVSLVPHGPLALSPGYLIPVPVLYSTKPYILIISYRRHT